MNIVWPHQTHYRLILPETMTMTLIDHEPPGLKFGETPDPNRPEPVECPYCGSDFARSTVIHAQEEHPLAGDGVYEFGCGTAVGLHKKIAVRSDVCMKVDPNPQFGVQTAYRDGHCAECGSEARIYKGTGMCARCDPDNFDHAVDPAGFEAAGSALASQGEYDPVGEGDAAPHPAMHMAEDDFKYLFRENLKDMQQALKERRDAGLSPHLRRVPQHLQAALDAITD